MVLQMLLCFPTTRSDPVQAWHGQRIAMMAQQPRGTIVD